MTRERLVRMLSVTSAMLAGVLVVLLLSAAYLWNLARTLPDLRADPDAYNVAETSIVYAADGSVLAEWYDTEDRTVVASDVIPNHLKQAAVSIEDRRFYEHHGIDFEAIGRAISVNAGSGRVEQGGSTITQQTVKLLFTDRSRTITRKIEEALLALELETRANKDEVLSVYLNTVYFGRGAYGVESAARRFFGVGTQELTLSQSALLAGCIQSPTRYDPFANPADALGRRNLVLQQMRDQGYLTAADAAEASAEPLGLRQAPQTAASEFAPYFVEYVRRDLLNRLGSKTLYGGGLRIYTTLDPAAQRAAEAAVSSVLPAPEDPEVAIASVRWSDGAVVAVVGGRDFASEKFDLATQGKRQTGSAFKPFVLAAALEQGYSLNSQWDASPFSTPVKDGVWTVENYENNITSGTYTLETATIWSINTVYARLITAVGADKVVDVAKRMGITSQLDADPAIALGGLRSGVSPLEMASAFGTIANRGVTIEPSGVAKVTDSEGEIVYQPSRAGSRAISENVALTLGQVLSEVYQYGTGAGAQFGQWAAVKTGTSQSWADAWIVGYSGDISTAVWVGNRAGQVPMDNVRGIRVTGGSFPAQIWKSCMQVQAVKQATVSDNEIGDAEWQSYTMCSDSFKLARPDCPNKAEMAFPAGSVSSEVCDLKH